MKRFLKTEHQKIYFFNTGWLLAEKVIRIFANFIVGIQVARYLGKENFGILNYALGYVALFIPFATLGLGDILVRELMHNSEKENRILGTALFMRVASAICVISLIFLFLYFTEGDAYYRFITILVSFAVFFQSFDIFDRYFQAKLKSTTSVKANLIAMIIISALKIALVYLKAPLFYFAIAYVLEFASIAFILILFFQASGFRLSLLKVDFKLVTNFLKQSWPLVLSGLMVVIYTRIDQVMIRNMVANPAAELGKFSAAVKLSEAFYFLPVVIISALYPAIINGKKISEEVYKARFQKLIDLFTWISLPISIVISLIAAPLCLFLYGKDFLGAGDVLTIHIWASVFVFWGMITIKWYIVEKLPRFVTINTALGCITNVVLNLILIPRYGIKGAALATVAAQSMAAFLSLLMFKTTRPLAFNMIRSLNFIRIINSLRAKYLPNG